MLSLGVARLAGVRSSTRFRWAFAATAAVVEEHNIQDQQQRESRHGDETAARHLA